MDEKVRMYDRPCKNCLFSKSRLVTPERAAELINEALRNNSFFVCHQATLNGENIACHAFIQHFRQTNPTLRWVDMNQGFEVIPIDQD